MPMTPHAQALALNWLFGGAAASRPAARYVSFATATPTATAGQEFDGVFTPIRATLSMGVANSPAGSASNMVAFSATKSGAGAATAKGINIYDAAAAGNRLFYGGIANIGCKSTDTLAMAAGGLTFTLT